MNRRLEEQVKWICGRRALRDTLREYVEGCV